MKLPAEKNNSKTQEKQQRNPKIRSFNYAKRWLYLQKKQKRFSNQTNQKKKKDNFYLEFVSKITDKVTQKIKEKTRTDLS